MSPPYHRDSSLIFLGMAPTVLDISSRLPDICAGLGEDVELFPMISYGDTTNITLQLLRDAHRLTLSVLSILQSLPGREHPSGWRRNTHNEDLCLSSGTGIVASVQVHLVPAPANKSLHRMSVR